MEVCEVPNQCQIVLGSASLSLTISKVNTQKVDVCALDKV